MQLHLTEQRPHFSKHLAYWKTRPVMRYGPSSLKEKTSMIAIRTSRPVDPGPLFAYQVFPPGIMSYHTQWREEERDIRVGDTIVQQIHLPPFHGFSVKIIVGVRVHEVIHTPEQRGFGYETLEGHVEMGTSSFTLEGPVGDQRFVVRTSSAPGLAIGRLLAPIFTTPYQTYCTRAAMRNMARQLQDQEPLDQGDPPRSGIDQQAMGPGASSSEP